MSQPEHTVDPSAVRAIVGQFEGVRREHPHFNSAYNRAMELTSVGRASRVVIITGPTGVGKSTLGESMPGKCTPNMYAHHPAKPIMAIRPCLTSAALEMGLGY